MRRVDEHCGSDSIGGYCRAADNASRLGGYLSRAGDGADDLRQRTGERARTAVVELPHEGKHRCDDLCRYGLSGISVHCWHGDSAGGESTPEEGRIDSEVVAACPAAVIQP